MVPPAFSFNNKVSGAGNADEDEFNEEMMILGTTPTFGSMPASGSNLAQAHMQQAGGANGAGSSGGGAGAPGGGGMGGAGGESGKASGAPSPPPAMADAAAALANMPMPPLGALMGHVLGDDIDDIMGMSPGGRCSSTAVHTSSAPTFSPWVLGSNTCRGCACVVTHVLGLEGPWSALSSACACQSRLCSSLPDRAPTCLDRPCRFPIHGAQP